MSSQTFIFSIKLHIDFSIGFLIIFSYEPPLFISLNSNLNETVIVANQPTFIAYRNNKTVIINFNGTYANSGDNITSLIGEENLPCSF